MTTQQISWMGPSHTETKQMIMEIMRTENESKPLKQQKLSRRAIINEARRLLRHIFGGEPLEDSAPCEASFENNTDKGVVSPHRDCEPALQVVEEVSATGDNKTSVSDM